MNETSAAMEAAEELKAGFFVSLKKHQVEFMVIGGCAVGRPRNRDDSREL